MGSAPESTTATVTPLPRVTRQAAVTPIAASCACSAGRTPGGGSADRRLAETAARSDDPPAARDRIAGRRNGGPAVTPSTATTANVTTVANVTQRARVAWEACVPGEEGQVWRVRAARLRGVSTTTPG